MYLTTALTTTAIYILATSKIAGANAAADAPPPALLARQKNAPGYDFCHGRGGICDLYADHDWPDCNKFTPSSKEWNACYCETGRLSARFACEYCESYYGLFSAGILDFATWKATCASFSLTVAPIPAEMYTSWASYNATQTANTARPTGSISTRRYVSIPTGVVTSVGSDDVIGGVEIKTTTASSGSSMRVTSGSRSVVPTATNTGSVGSPSATQGAAGGGSSAGRSHEASFALVGIVLGGMIFGTLAL